MYREESKFLDLDMVAERILNTGDREMFREAIKCYQIGSHRAAVILAWMATADCLKRRLEDLCNEGDPAAQTVRETLNEAEGSASFEEKLINSCRECELFDIYEDKCLRFARDVRSKCAHPSGVIPSAEAVRHILEICSQIVLCRSSYRGTGFIKDVVTVQFDDPDFLPYESRAAESCNSIIDKVPERLWYLFTKCASQARPNASNEIWRKNALTFFKVLLERCSDQTLVDRIASGMQGFEAHAPVFFASLVGLEIRVSRFWGKQKRDQARAKLAGIPAPQVKNYDVEAWATICQQDGFEKSDFLLLKARITIFSRYFPKDFLNARREEIFSLLAEMTEDNSLADHAAIALKRLLNSNLCDLVNDDSQRILKQIIQRFVNNEKYREVLSDNQSWKDQLLIQFLTLSEDFLLECCEDNPDDIFTLFEAASELAQRNHLLIPEEFGRVIRLTLEGSIQNEWQTSGSIAGRNFKNQLELLFERYSAFNDLKNACTELLLGYLPKEEEDNTIDSAFWEEEAV